MAQGVDVSQDNSAQNGISQQQQDKDMLGLREGPAAGSRISTGGSQLEASTAMRRADSNVGDSVLGRLSEVKFGRLPEGMDSGDGQRRKPGQRIAEAGSPDLDDAEFAAGTSLKKLKGHIDREQVSKMKLTLGAIMSILQEIFASSLAEIDGQDIIMVLGNTGSGKSTLLTSLLHGPESLVLKVVEQDVGAGSKLKPT